MTIKDLERRIKGTTEEETRGLHIFSPRTRRDVYRELSRLPCRTSSSISRSLGIDARVVEWHLKKLHGEGFVETWIRGRRYYYIPSLVDLGDLEFFALLNRKSVRVIVRYLLEGCREIRDIPVPRSTLYRDLRLLENMDMVLANRGTRSYVCPGDKLKRMKEKYNERGANFKRELVKMLEYPGFSVVVLGEVNHELKLEINGLENFTMGVFISPLETSLEV